MIVSQSCLLVPFMGMLMVVDVMELPASADALLLAAALLLLLLLQPSSRLLSTPDHCRRIRE
jgi:hypothetical protein